MVNIKDGLINLFEELAKVHEKDVDNHIKTLNAIQFLKGFDVDPLALGHAVWLLCEEVLDGKPYKI